MGTAIRATHPCLICGRRPSDAHHLRFSQPRALGRKVSDEFTVPPCRTHHREVHRRGDEAAWWENTRIEPNAAARALWLQTHPQLPKPNAVRLQDARLIGFPVQLSGAKLEPEKACNDVPILAQCRMND